MPNDMTFGRVNRPAGPPLHAASRPYVPPAQTPAGPIDWRRKWGGGGMGGQGMPPMGGGPGAPPTGGPMNPPADPPTGGPMNPPVGNGPPMGQPPFGQQPMPSKEQLYMMHFGSQPPWVQNAYMQQWQQEAQAGQPLSTNWFNRGLFGMPENG